MDPNLQNEIRRIFMAASELSESQRAAFLDESCAGNAILRAEVEALLISLHHAGDFLGAPTANPMPETVERENVDWAATTGASLREGPGSLIGPYKLLKLIGEGGFGSVFMAEQHEPMIRRVALKIIKLGMDTRQVIARFEAERQALSMMEHPNIARVFDGGATETGRPYFVMELVAGDPITDYCDKNNIAIRDRLELFEQVCAAVQHAHMKGIIHRDIKPSNVLVSTQDGRPVVKVIDFGIAKATDARLSERTYFTEHNQMIGTPAYMSPEQAEGSPDIDTRTDVYSLGVLLYELLTGATPFDTRRLRSAAYQELCRIIREEEPPKPSTRLSQSVDTLAGVAARRRTEPKRLGTIIRGELDWIVMKAMEKPRQRRYETPSDLASDIRRYLGGEPVMAAPPSAAYRFRKFAKRNRISISVSGTIAACIVIASISLIRTSGAAARAEEQSKAAEATRQFLVDAFSASDAFAGGTTDISVADAMLQGIDKLKRGGLDEQPELKAKILDVAVEVLVRNKKGEAAAAPAEELLSILKRLHPADHQDVAHGMYRLATVYQDVSKLPEAERLFRLALEMAKRLHKDDHPDIAEYQSDLALAIQAQGRNDQAEPLFTEALAMYRRLHKIDHEDLAAAIKNVGYVKLAHGRKGEAEPFYEEALAMRKRLYKGDHPFVAISLLDLADLKFELKKLSAAEQGARTAHAMCLRHPEWRSEIRNWALDLYSRVLRSLGRSDQLIPVFLQEVSLARMAASRSNRELAVTLAGLGGRLVSLGSRTSEQAALSPLQESLSIREREYPDGDSQAWKKYNSMSLLGEAILGSAGVFAPTSQPSDRSSPTSKPDAAMLHSAFVEAEPLLLRAWEHLRADPNVPKPDQNAGGDRRRDALERVVRLYEAWSQNEPGQGHEKQAAEWRRLLSSYNPENSPK